MASIKRRITAKGEARYDVRVRIGARVATKTFARRQDADRWARTMDADVVTGTAIDPRAGKELLSHYAARWLSTRRVDGHPLAPRTAELYRDLLERHIEPVFGAVPLSQVRTDAVRAWHANLAERVSPLQAAKAYRLFRGILKTAVDDRLLAENPCRISGAGKERTGERRFVAPEEILRFADTIDKRYRALVLIAAFGGLRLGELLALRRRNFDARARTLIVEEQAVQLRSGARVLTSPKTAAGRRTVHLPRVAAEALQRHLEVFVDSRADAIVFTGPERWTVTPRHAVHRVAPGTGGQRHRGAHDPRPAALGCDARGLDGSEHERAHGAARPRVTASRAPVSARGVDARSRHRRTARRGRRASATNDDERE